MRYTNPGFTYLLTWTIDCICLLPIVLCWKLLN